MELEFNHYDCRGTGAISARDLALSIASNADMATVQHVLSRIGSMPPEVSGSPAHDQQAASDVHATRANLHHSNPLPARAAELRQGHARRLPGRG